MRYIFAFFVILINVFSCDISPARENKDLMRANYYYNHLAFYEAIPYFEKMASEENTAETYTRLADCYRLTNNLHKAADWYAKAVAMKDCKDPVLLCYGHVLMQLTQYDEAEKQLKLYQEKNKKDKRVANMISGCESAKTMMQKIPPGIVTFMDFNTNGSEFAPTIWKGKLVFASDTEINLKKKTDKWTGNSYYNLYYVPSDAAGHCGGDYHTVATGNDLNIKYHDGPCTFSADGTQMYFTRNRYSNNFFGKNSIANSDSVVLLEIMIASEYDTARKCFKKITSFEYNSKDYSVAHPAVSPNGKVLVFSSTMPKGYGGTDLYLCRKVKDNWSKPQNAGSMINTEGEEVFPYWGDDSTLFFSSDGHEGLGGLDIYKTRWDEKSNTFSVPENIGIPVNSSYDDISLALYPDGRSSYFSSNRPAQKGGDNIYFFRKELLYLQLNVIDSLTQRPLAGTHISLDGAIIKKDATTDNNGLLFTRLYPELPYNVRISTDEYITKQLEINATSSKETDTIFKTVKLTRPPEPDHNTIAQIQPEPVVIKNKNVMDSPGIKTFVIGEVYEVGHFYYEYDKYSLTEAHKIFLDTLLTQLKRHPTMRIEIRAHTDCRGGDAYNELLSKNRALTVVNFLIDHGVSRKRLEYIGLGYSDPTIKCPICEQCTEEQHYLNRLLEFKVLEL